MDLTAAMFLWIPNSQAAGVEESDELISQVTRANGAVMDFCDGIISLDDAFDVIHDNGADMDLYVESLAQTLWRFGA